MPESSSAPPQASSDAAPKRQLTLFDSTCIIVGIIIGAGIYQTAPSVAAGGQHWWGLLLLWLAGGVLSLCGAMNYAELATAYPREGGDYVYLTRAYGRWAGFLFGWMQLTLVRPGDIALMAFAFATYARALFDPFGNPDIQQLHATFATNVVATANMLHTNVGDWIGNLLRPESIVSCFYASAAVVVLTLVNVIGARAGTWTQNVLTVVKALGLLAIVGVGLFGVHSPPSAAAGGGFPLTVALILVLFTYGGWNEMAYVAAEVKRPERNIVRALMLGTGGVIVLYLLLNVAFLASLGYAGLANSKAVASDTVAASFPSVGSRLISILICISALGAVNGLIFTGARISYAVGADHRAFRPLGKWSARSGTPQRALLLQGLLAVVLILALGSFLDTIIYTAAAVYLFYLATSLAVVVLRWREPEVARPYRVTLYPIPTIVFCAVCLLLIHGAIDYKPTVSLVAIGIALAGLPVYWLTSARSDRATE